MLPRKSVHRTTFFALFSLIALSAYLFLVAKPTLALTPFVRQRPVSPLPLSSKHRIIDHNYVTVSPLLLTHSQELAAVTSFLESLPQNIIPPSIDPSQPIDPQLVLDFDTQSPRAPEEVQAMVDEVWTRNPVVLYSKFYSPASREVKSILTGMHLRPEPTIFDVDLRDDGAVLMPLLSRLIESSEFPVLLIGGKPVGSLQHIRDLRESGELWRMVTASGAIIGGAQKKKGHQ